MGTKKVVKKGKTIRKSAKSPKKSSFYKVQGETLSVTKKFCPKCGHGVFMAEHKDRVHCGKCGYSEFKKEA